MSDSYTKLFSTLSTSTIWSEPLATRVVWITMLSLADKSGEVGASVPGLARVANVSLAECEEALRCFLSPDAYSRTKDNEGRRIAVIDGGWRLLNHRVADRLRQSAEVWRVTRARIFERDDYTCAYCGARGCRLECDHVIPVSRGGSNDDSNLTTACFVCNRSKRSKLLTEWSPSRV